MNPKITALAHSRQGSDRVIQPDTISASKSHSFEGIEPPELARVLRDAQCGDMERFADLVSYMLRTDTHVRSVWTTRVNAVVSSRLTVEPGPAPDALAGVAEQAAEFVKGQFEATEEFEDRLSDLMHGVGIGVAALELKREPRHGVFDGKPATIVSHTPLFVHGRDLRFTEDWRVAARTRAGGKVSWVVLDDNPGQFMVHRPHNISDHSTVTGELMPVMWAWLFRRWVEKYGLDGFERLASGLLVGVVAQNAGDVARRTLREGLEQISAAGVGIVEELAGQGLPIHLLEPGKDPGAAAIALIGHYNNEISKAILGSGLNVEVQDTGGNRALGESQFDTTILPRLKADARRLAGTLERDWARPLLIANTHLFGGITPPTPRITLGATEETAEVVPIDDLTVTSQAVTVDEIREKRHGLEPWGPERGGDRVAQPVAKGPAFAQVPAQISGGEEPAPFVRKPKRPSARRRASSPTPSASTHPLAIALREK